MKYEGGDSLLKVLWQPKKIINAVGGIIFGAPLSLLRPGNIAMFHVGRCGSTVLTDLLNQNPGIFWDGEVYTYERFIASRFARMFPRVFRYLVRDPMRILRLRMPRAGKRFYGFETQFYHLNYINISPPDYIEQLRNLGFSHFITLERKNYLRIIVSALVVMKTNRFRQDVHKSPKPTQVELNVDNVYGVDGTKPLITYLKYYDESLCKFKETLKDQEFLQLTYEDDISADPLIGYGRVCSFLGLERHEVSIRMGKVNPFKLTEIITNFKEVERTLWGTPFEWMLYE